jgi:hypothetical protein
MARWLRSRSRHPPRRALMAERGLPTGVPPGFDRKQRFYVDYTDLNGNTVIAQYRVP